MRHKFFLCNFANFRIISLKTSENETDVYVILRAACPHFGIFGDIAINHTGFDQVTVTTTMLDDGGFSPIISGFCWREGNSGIPTLVDNVVNVSEISHNQLTAVLTGLLPDTEYVVSAYSVNSRGMGFSQGFTFRTPVAE